MFGLNVKLRNRSRIKQTNNRSCTITTTLLIRKLRLLLEPPDGRRGIELHKNAVMYELFKLLLRHKIRIRLGPRRLREATDHISFVLVKHGSHSSSQNDTTHNNTHGLFPTHRTNVHSPSFNGLLLFPAGGIKSFGRS